MNVLVIETQGQCIQLLIKKLATPATWKDQAHQHAGHQGQSQIISDRHKGIDNAKGNETGLDDMFSEKQAWQENQGESKDEQFKKKSEGFSRNQWRSN